jgi:hypothetical protein
MIEYLIKRTDGEWFDLPAGSDPYRPTTIPFKREKGWGDGRILVAGCVVSFSFEDPGIQVSFEGKIDNSLADKVVDEVRQRIEQVSGQKGEVIRLT